MRRGPEWFCERCRRWVNGLCCPGCLVCDPASVRWATESEIAEARLELVAHRGEAHG